MSLLVTCWDQCPCSDFLCLSDSNPYALRKNEAHKKLIVILWAVNIQDIVWKEVLQKMSDNFGDSDEIRLYIFFMYRRMDEVE